MSSVKGYLVRDWPGVIGSTGLGFQLFMACFMATVLVPLLTGLDPRVTLLTSGLATIAGLCVNGFSIPLYYGSSFAVILAAKSVMLAAGGGTEAVRVLQAGIVVASLVEILIGIVIARGGKKLVDKIFPPVVTGPVAMIIAYGLSTNAINDASGVSSGFKDGNATWWALALITLTIGIVWAVFFGNKGLLGKLSILGALVIGTIAAIPLGLFNVPTGPIVAFSIPPITFPNFSSPLVFMSALLISTTVLAQVPESIAHILQIDIISKNIGRMMGREATDLSGKVGINLISDGVADLVCGALGGAMGTNYGETGTHSMLSKSVSIYAVVAAAIFAILASTSGHVAAAISMVPKAAIGGMEIVLFGGFGLVGLMMLLSLKEKLLEPRNVMIAAVILVLGLAGGNGFNGSLPIPLSPEWSFYFPAGLPAMAVAAFLGILMNIVLPQIASDEQESAVPRVPVYETK